MCCTIPQFPICVNLSPNMQIITESHSSHYIALLCTHWLYEEAMQCKIHENSFLPDGCWSLVAITFPANNNITSAPHGTDDEDNATLNKTLTASFRLFSA